MQNSNEAVLASATVIEQPAVQTSWPKQEELTKLPRWMLFGIVIVCVLPFLLNTLGIDFASPAKVLDLSTAGALSPAHLTDALFYQLNGAFTHALLEWAAFSIAIFTFVLAFSHYRITGNITTPIIGFALLCAGCMDAFHTLAATRLIEALAENNSLVPFTWAISRVFNASIMVLGISFLLLSNINKIKSQFSYFVVVSLVFVLVAYLVIDYAATHAQLPQTMFPDAAITRPWDVAPLLLFLIAGLYIYPRFYKKNPSLFAHALVLSAIPQVVVEIHMAFGSTALFDNHFNIAHFLKIIAYAVPFSGLVLDYIRIHRQLDITNKTLGTVLEKSKASELALTVANKHAVTTMTRLEQSNQELEQFAYIASHDLREPLRKISNYAELFAQRYADKVDEKGNKYIGYITDGTQRMDRLIHDLLLYSRASQSTDQSETLDMNEVLKTALENIELSVNKSQAKITHDDLPVVSGKKTQLEQVLQNLISNAIKFCGDKPPRIHIAVIEYEKEWEFSVRDEGIGFDSQQAQRIFSIFKRLHTHNKYDGTGIGLAICKTCVERHDGRIWAESDSGKGATFFFTISKSLHDPKTLNSNTR
ncbi:MAG: hypothetical protein JKY90_06275 [Gammaproteobacteria bacterium]|nr:hypothetical protein [Gammaproteobacteria bacterium]